MRRHTSVLSAGLLGAAGAITSAAAQPAVDLIANGDFEAGNTGFTSEYVYTPGPNTAGGQYHVLADASTWNRWFRCRDHTSGAGLFMAVNGAPSSMAVVWSQQVAVAPGATYAVGFWLAAIDTPLNNRARIQMRINGVQVGSVITAPGPAGAWVRFAASWDSGAAATARLEIVDLTLASSGDDFGLDDISFVGPCPGSVRAYGNGLAGAGGIAPQLTADGCPLPGRAFALAVSRGRGDAPALLLLGAAAANTAWLGGTLLVDPRWPALLVATRLDGPANQPGAGGASLDVVVPDAPAVRGVTVYGQVFVLDSAAVAGVAMTAGLAVTIG